ncbi:ATP-binding cassette sub-family F member 2-like protein [Anopheles sinensis]|uniref:ATP-binding cassette sub-family F member 2-like protein n=1 Tax=Anopheles sinensis TaxID=74873 RepID=A0A084WTP0_ANOSI|nr:ATP-binding cassette sub-family F member 2-like protein [Anopheles sinensis]
MPIATASSSLGPQDGFRFAGLKRKTPEDANRTESSSQPVVASALSATRSGARVIGFSYHPDGSHRLCREASRVTGYRYAHVFIIRLAAQSQSTTNHHDELLVPISIILSRVIAVVC